jgi:hypothetical protein
MNLKLGGLIFLLILITTVSCSDNTPDDPSAIEALRSMYHLGGER